MQRSAAVLALLMASATGLSAQAERQTGFLVHNANVCAYSGMTEVNALTAEWVPILEALREEGMLRAWYDIRHAWGDEWNVGIVFVTDSHRAFLDFWSEFIRRVRESNPGHFARFFELCTLHKDNMYSVRDSRAGEL